MWHIVARKFAIRKVPIMCYLLTAAAINFNAPGLKSAAKHVLIVLAHHVNSKSSSPTCWPAVERIAQMSGMSPRAAQYALRTLENIGLVRVQHRLGTSPRYTITLPGAASAESAPTAAEFAPPPLQNLHPNKEVEFIKNTNTAHTASPVPVPPPRRAPPPAAPLCVPEELKTIGPQMLEDFAVVRKTKKKAPMPTRTEAQDLAEQAQRAGLTVAQAVRLCIVKGWARFEAAWVQDRRSAQQDAAVPSKPVETWKPETVNASPIPDEVRKRWAEMRAEIAGRTGIIRPLAHGV